MAKEAQKIPISRSEIADFCRRHRIRKLSLFGSLLRDDFGPKSDVDVLVEFEPDARVGFFKLYDLEQQLSQLLGGRRVDINTPNSLSKHFRDEVLAEAEVLYVQA
ncbi:MAG: nucleotidyltransferase family protein [Deltaproteobacteria bacterium]|nr:MAG: nucleotidyltransferase family protein [Deltaproteobacteria bacterium]